MVSSGLKKINIKSIPISKVKKPSKKNKIIKKSNFVADVSNPEKLIDDWYNFVFIAIQKRVMNENKSRRFKGTASVIPKEFPFYKFKEETSIKLFKKKDYSLIYWKFKEDSINVKMVNSSKLGKLFEYFYKCVGKDKFRFKLKFINFCYNTKTSVLSYHGHYEVNIINNNRWKSY